MVTYPNSCEPLRFECGFPSSERLGVVAVHVELAVFRVHNAESA